MEKKSFVSLLDVVLRHLESYKEPKNIYTIDKGLNKEIPKHILNTLLNKLISDKYIDYIDELETGGFAEFSGQTSYIRLYQINFDGISFNLFGGYEAQEAKQNAEGLRLDRMEFEATANRLLTTRLTILIAAGTLVAAVYYGIEIYKELHLFFHHHDRYWLWETIPKTKK